MQGGSQSHSNVTSVMMSTLLTSVPKTANLTAIVTASISTTSNPTTAGVATTTASPATRCTGIPQLLRGGDLLNCSGLPNGSICQARCLPGYSLAGEIVCQKGTWKVPGVCLPNGAEAKEVCSALQMQINLQTRRDEHTGAEAPGMIGLTLEWAQSHSTSIAEAIASLLELQTDQVQVDIVPTQGTFDSNNSNRLLTAPPSQGFDIRIVVLPSNKTLTSAEEQQMLFEIFMKLLSGNGNRTLVSALASQLISKGQPVPYDLLGSVIAPSSEAPSVLDNFMVIIPDWLLGDWKPCSTTCGRGQTLRSVLCSSGYDAACAAIDRPTGQIDCSVYASCPFELGCPLGPGSLAPCWGQIVAVVFIFILLIAIAILSIWRLCYLCPPHRGSLRLPFQEPPTEFRVVRPSIDVGHEASNKSEGRVVHQVEKTEVPKALKTVVIWDIDVPSVKQWFQIHEGAVWLTPRKTQRSSSDLELGARACPSNDVNLSGPDLSKMGQDHELAKLAACIDHLVQGQRSARSSAVWKHHNELPTRDLLLQTAPANVAGASAAYIDGETVEYYSRTHACWLRAIIKISWRKDLSRVSSLSSMASQGTKATNPSWGTADDNYLHHPNHTVLYNVETLGISRRTTRVNVALEHLRLPFKAGEIVEMWSHRAGGSWVLVTVCEKQLTASVPLAYHVLQHEGATGADSEVQANGQPQARSVLVPADRLRKYYQPGRKVQVFRGSILGWQPAQVAFAEDCLGEEPPASYFASVVSGNLSQKGDPVFHAFSFAFAEASHPLKSLRSDAEETDVADDHMHFVIPATSVTSRRVPTEKSSERIEQWFWLPVLFKEVSSGDTFVQSAAAIRWVPSFLLR